MLKIKVLVTGAGSGVGQSIIKALNISNIKCEVISADINYLNAALYRTKKAIIVPKVESKGALNWYLKNLKKLRINVLMVGSEFDLVFFSKNAIITSNGINFTIVIKNYSSINSPCYTIILGTFLCWWRLGF